MLSPFREPQQFQMIIDGAIFATWTGVWSERRPTLFKGGSDTRRSEEGQNRDRQDPGAPGGVTATEAAMRTPKTVLLPWFPITG
jgi:hypothetical protein